MIYHFNIRVSLSRETFVDDSYGGAVATGTVYLREENSRIDYYLPREALTRVPGLETDKAYTFFFHVNTQHPVPLRENDIVQITFPPDHPNINDRFRVRGISREASHPRDPRGVIEAYCERIETTRGINF